MRVGLNYANRFALLSSFRFGLPLLLWKDSFLENLNNKELKACFTVTEDYSVNFTKVTEKQLLEVFLQV